MSLGSWNGAPAGSSPAHMSAWSLLRLGWVTPTDVTTAQVGAAIDSIETSGKVFRLSLPGTTSEYFLIENRQPIGFDAALLGTGLLIWHVDDSQTSNDQDNHRLLDLEEADEGVSGDRPTDSTRRTRSVTCWSSARSRARTSSCRNAATPCGRQESRSQYCVCNCRRSQSRRASASGPVKSGTLTA